MSKEGNKNILIVGLTGAGKSSLFTCLANNLPNEQVTEAVVRHNETSYKLVRTLSINEANTSKVIEQFGNTILNLNEVYYYQSQNILT